jgi:hypothetical protein
VSKVKVLTPPRRPLSYIVINEARSGSSWLQEISQMHPGIKASLANTFRRSATKHASLRPNIYCTHQACKQFRAFYETGMRF